MPNALMSNPQSRPMRNSFHPPDPPEPTDCLPGTVEKLAVFRRRLDAGWMLHHPADRTWASDPDSVDLEWQTR